MQLDEILTIIYNFRHAPELNAVAEIFDFTIAHRLLNKETGIGWAGVITALCDKYPLQSPLWRETYGAMLSRAWRIATSESTQQQRQWADYLTYRWIILATAESAWELLQCAHNPENKDLAEGAQTAISKICYSQDSKPTTSTQGDLQGKTQFEDLRVQMLTLAGEFKSMTPKQRAKPYGLALAESITSNFLVH